MVLVILLILMLIKLNVLFHYALNDRTLTLTEGFLEIIYDFELGYI